MNPLLIAHLVADFLLQPGKLVIWKEKKVQGIAVHALVHAVVMALFIFPSSVASWAVVCFIATTHGVIDETKVVYQKKYPGFARWFVLDQLVHLIIIVIASLFLTSTPAIWSSEGGVIMSFTLLFFSFGIAWKNLAKKFQNKTVTGLLLLGVFALFSASAFIL